MASKNTRTELIETGTRMLLQTGYNHTGIQSLLQAVGVPKGSFYCHFSNKEDFGLQVVEHYCRKHTAYLERYLSDESQSPLTRLRRYFEFYIEYYASLQCQDGCLLGNLAAEMADQNETFRTRLEELFTGWRERLAECLKRAQEVGEVPAELDVTAVAEFCLNSWEGAVLRMKTCKSVAPLHTFVSLFFDSLLKG